MNLKSSTLIALIASAPQAFAASSLRRQDPEQDRGALQVVRGGRGRAPDRAHGARELEGPQVVQGGGGRAPDWAQGAREVEGLQVVQGGGGRAPDQAHGAREVEGPQVVQGGGGQAPDRAQGAREVEGLQVVRGGGGRAPDQAHGAREVEGLQDVQGGGGRAPDQAHGARELEGLQVVQGGGGRAPDQAHGAREVEGPQVVQGGGGHAPHRAHAARELEGLQVVQGGGGRAPDPAHGARELEASQAAEERRALDLRGQDPAQEREAGAMQVVQGGERRLLEAGEYWGFCTDFYGQTFLNRNTYLGLGSPEECLASCPPSVHLVGYEFAAQDYSYTGVCHCRYSPPYRVTGCPPEAQWCERGYRGNSPQVYGGTGSPPFVCRKTGVILHDCDRLQVQGGYCGECRDERNREYDYISFLDVSDHHQCLLNCPPSDKFVGYEYAPHMGIIGEENVCWCRYSPGYVQYGYAAGENGCPANAGRFRESPPCDTVQNSSRGVGTVASGSGDRRIACRTQFANGLALWWAYSYGIGSSMTPVEFGEWAANPSADPNTPSANPSALVRYATRYRSDFRSMFDLETHPDGVAIPHHVSGWDVSNGLDFFGMFWQRRGFNLNVGAWDVSKGTDFAGMFGVAEAFNADISAWDVSKGLLFQGMFMHANNFAGDLSQWQITVSIERLVLDMFKDSGMTDLRHCPCVKVCAWELSCAFVDQLTPSPILPVGAWQHVAWKRWCPGTDLGPSDDATCDN